MVANYFSPSQNYLVTGRILPERHQFSHPPVTFFIKDDVSKIDIQCSFLIESNQFTAKILGNISGQSITVIARIANNCVKQILNAHAFVTGEIFSADIISIIRDSGNDNGRIEYHYLRGIHDAIANRKSKFNSQMILSLILSNEGEFIVSCLDNLKAALESDMIDTPFYCFRAIENIRHNFIQKCALDKTKKKQQWELVKSILKISDIDMKTLTDLSEAVRHGENIRFKGSEWRNIIELTWTIIEKHLEHLQNVLDGKIKWPKTVTNP